MIQHLMIYTTGHEQENYEFNSKFSYKMNLMLINYFKQLSLFIHMI